MSRVLVTGANGFVGRNALRFLVEHGHDVVAVSSRAGLSRDDVEWRTVDLLVEDEARRLVRDIRPDALLHLAWYTEPGQYWDSGENHRWLQASLALAEAFARAGGRRLVVAGSCAEYDWTDGVCIENATPLLPTSIYGRSKKELFERLQALASETGVSLAWGRLFFLYGPREHPSRVVATVISALLRGDLALCSHGTQVRDFMHVADAASAFVALLESRVGGAVNIAAGHAVVLRELIEMIAGKLQRPDLLRFGAVAARAGEPPVIAADVQRLTREVEWAPHFDLSTGVDDTIRWWRSAEAFADTR